MLLSSALVHFGSDLSLESVAVHLLLGLHDLELLSKGLME